MRRLSIVVSLLVCKMLIVFRLTIISRGSNELRLFVLFVFDSTFFDSKFLNLVRSRFWIRLTGDAAVMNSSSGIMQLITYSSS